MSQPLIIKFQFKKPARKKVIACNNLGFSSSAQLSKFFSTLFSSILCYYCGFWMFIMYSSYPQLHLHRISIQGVSKKFGEWCHIRTATCCMWAHAHGSLETWGVMQTDCGQLNIVSVTAQWSNMQTSSATNWGKLQQRYLKCLCRCTGGKPWAENVFTLSWREGNNWEWATFGSAIDKQNPRNDRESATNAGRRSWPSNVHVFKMWMPFYINCFVKSDWRCCFINSYYLNTKFW